MQTGLIEDEHETTRSDAGYHSLRLNCDGGSNRFGNAQRSQHLEIEVAITGDGHLIGNYYCLGGRNEARGRCKELTPHI